jgi:hypothetical protein
MSTTLKDLLIPLEQFPHLSNQASVHEAVGLLFSHSERERSAAV